MKHTIPNKVCEFRQAINVTQEELAGAVGVSRQTIISIEKESCDPSVCLALKISNFLKHPLEEVFLLPDNC
jgi:putative transcriptional regulator